MSSSENQRMGKLTVPQLRNLLKQRGLPCKGLKAELVKRLLEADGSGETEGAGTKGSKTEGAGTDGSKTEGAGTEGSKTEGAGTEGGEPGGGAYEDGRKRKAEVLGRGGKRKSKPTRGFISEESDDNKEDSVSAGDEAIGKDPVKMNHEEEAAETDARDKTGEKDSRENTVEKDFRKKTVEKDSREKIGEKDSREENKYFEKIRSDGWYLKNFDRYKHLDRSTEDLAAEGLKNFKAFKVTLDAKLPSNAYSKISSLRESLAESARFYMAVIESAKKVDKADQVLTAGRNVIACLSHLINYVGPKEAFDITVVAAETITKVCREVPESLLLQGSAQAGRRGLLEVWTSLAVNLVGQAGQLQTKEVVSRLEQVLMFKVWAQLI